MSFEKNLDKYAKLAIKVGVNIQEGQTLLVRSPIECAPFVRKVVKHAYEAGAKNVHIEWSDEECTLLKYLHAPDETFNEFPRWISDQYVDIAKEGGAFLTVYAQNPDLLKDVDPQRVANFQKASGVALKEWRSYTLSDKCNNISHFLLSPENSPFIFDAIAKLLFAKSYFPIEKNPSAR